MNDERTFELIEHAIEGTLDASAADELAGLLRTSAAARALYWECVAQHVLTEDLLHESRGRDLAMIEHGAPHERQVPVSQTKSPLLAHRWKVWLAAAACLVICASYFVMTRNPRAEKIAELRSVSGTVKVRDVQGRLSAATAGTAISPGEAIVVDAEEGSAQVVLEDGSQFHLQTDSTLAFSDRHQSQPSLHLERGGMFVDAMQQALGRPLDLATKHAHITALDTRFRLYTDTAMSRVELDAGTVEFKRRANGQSIEVAEGYYAVAMTHESPNDTVSPMTPRPLSTADCQLRRTVLRAGRIGCLSHDGKFLAAPRKDALRVWDLNSGEVVESISKLVPNHFRQVVFTADDRALIAIDKVSATFWRREDTSAKVLRLHEQQVRHTTIAPDGAGLAQSYSKDKQDLIAVWQLDAERGELTAGPTVTLKPWSESLVAAAQGSFIAVGEWNGQIDLVAAQSGTIIDALKLRSTPYPLAIADDARFVAAFANQEGLVLLDRQSNTNETGRRVLWPNTGARPGCLRFSADSRLLLAGMDDGLVRAWSTATGESLMVLETGDARVSWLDLSADGRCLATGGQHDSVKVWDCQWPQ